MIESVLYKFKTYCEEVEIKKGPKFDQLRVQKSLSVTLV